MARNNRYIVDELNKFLDTDYNIISFGDLRNEELLQVVCDVLYNLNAIAEFKVKKNQEAAIVAILEALQKVQYEPAVAPEEFREGIALGNTTIIYSILEWLLSNRKNVKQRAYLAKYVMKIECPPELLREPEIQATYETYEKLIEEFWKIYSENKKVEKDATVAIELQEGLMKLREDIASLSQRLEQQKQKVENIPNKEVLSVIVKNYRSQVIQNRKLQEQLATQQGVNSQLENGLKTAREVLTRKQGRRPSQVQPLEQITGELRTNRILAEEQLPEELERCKRELKIYEKVSSEPEPAEFEIEQLKTDLSKVRAEVQELVQQQIATTTNSTDELAPFRNQALIIANKKQELSNSVIELKEKIANIEPLIAEKHNMLLTIVGGPVLQGDDLKQYIAKLRNYSVVYKEYKTQLQSLVNELGTLTRTYEVLKNIDPTIEEKIQNTIQNHEESIPGDSVDIKNKIKKMSTEIDQVKADTARVREELKGERSQLQPLLEEHDKCKQKFDEHVGSIQTTLDNINEEIKEVLENLAANEGKWKKVHLENERKTNLLMKLQQDALDTVDEIDDHPLQIDLMKEQLNKIDMANQRLEKELNDLEYQKVQGYQQLQMLIDLVHLLEAKEKIIPY